MDLESAAILATNVDKSQIPPILQKRMLAFVNHFLISSCSFLNNFADTCESKFIEIERKIQKVEASLIIVEAKLSSIPDIEEAKVPTSEIVAEKDSSISNSNVVTQTETTKIQEETTSSVELQIQTDTGVKVSDDVRYKKYFKMLQFGVPAPAVKLKMTSEGLESDLLDTPNLILPDGRKEDPEN